MRAALRNLSVLLALVSCSDDRAASPGGAGNGSGGRDASVTTAGDGGTAPAGAGDARLRAGDIDGAFTAFQGRTTPGDSFGACLTRTLRIASGPGVTAILGRFGVAQVPVADIAGTRGLLVRRAEAWRGDAQITLTPGGRKTFSRARARNNGISAREYPTGDRLSVYFSAPALPASGARFPSTFDCTNGFRQGDTEVSVSMTVGGTFCSQTYQQPTGAGCQTDGGTVEATAVSGGVGDPWTVKLDNLLLDCGCTGTTCMRVRASGELHAKWMPRIDTTGLHPLLADLSDGGFSAAPYVSALAAGTRLDPLVRSLASVVAELDVASEECARAGQGSGVVFTVPGSMYGGSDLPVTASDAKIAAGILGAASAWIQIALAYDYPLELASLCTATECVSDAMLVERLNAALPAYAGRPLATARMTFDRALGLLVAGIDAAGPGSVVPRTADTTAGLAVLRAWFTAMQGSLAGGGVAFPSVSPVVRIDLRAFFATPPDFSRAMTDPLVYDAGIRWVEAFGQETVDRFLDLDWGGSYTSPNEAGDPLRALGDVLTHSGMVFDD